ncbi:MAG: lytic transglycosylase domain-containing protein [Ruminiclostridium sp.]|nr:lytic transglycosylase domain-containing protein [Ruminiclostridium sp.]
MKTRIAEIFQAKIAEIQSRVPLQIRSTEQEASFSSALAQAEETANRTLSLDTSVKTEVKENLKSSSSGSNEADFPRLSADEISTLMPRINAAIKSASQEYGVDENMIRSIIKLESSFQPYSLSTSGAMGLMQLMPFTADWLSVTDPYNIEQNIRGGTEYYRDQLAKFDGDVEKALAAYNKGPNTVIKYGGVPPQAESYVKRVLQYYQMYKASQY